MTRVTAPVVRPMTSDSLPAVAAPVSISSSSASMSDSDRPSRIGDRLAEDRALEVDPPEGADHAVDTLVVCPS